MNDKVNGNLNDNRILNDKVNGNEDRKRILGFISANEAINTAQAELKINIYGRQHRD